MSIEFQNNPKKLYKKQKFLYMIKKFTDFFQYLLDKIRIILYNCYGVKINYFTGDAMAKNLKMTILMDFYGGMLTEKRYNALDLYYNQDLSLAEIAEELDISRQGVRDAVKHGEKQLTELEEKLGLAKRFSDIQERIGQIRTILAHGANAEEIEKILNEIERFV